MQTGAKQHMIIVVTQKTYGEVPIAIKSCWKLEMTWTVFVKMKCKLDSGFR